MKTLHIQTIPHAEQRYDTVGDYWESGDEVEFRISRMADIRYEQLILVHELVEYFLVKMAGILIQDIDRFDKDFEAHRPPDFLGEPGDDPAAPYYHQHQMASLVERVFAACLGVDWAEYDRAVNEL